MRGPFRRKRRTIRSFSEPADIAARDRQKSRPPGCLIINCDESAQDARLPDWREASAASLTARMPGSRHFSAWYGFGVKSCLAIPID